MNLQRLQRINEELDKILMNEISTELKQRYVAGRQKQIDDLEDRIWALRSKKNVGEAKTITELFGHDYSNESVDHISFGGYSGHMSIDDKSVPVDFHKIRLIGLPKFTKTLGLYVRLADNKLDKLPNCDELSIHNYDLTADSNLNKIKFRKLDFDEGKLLYIPTQCESLVIGDYVTVGEELKIPSNLKELSIYISYYADPSNEKYKFTKLAIQKGILTYLDCTEKTLNILGVTPNTPNIKLNKDYYYSEKLQKWFKSKEYEQRELGIYKELEDVEEDGYLYIEAITGVEGSILTDISYEEFIKMSKSEQKEKIISEIEDGSSDFDAGSINLEDLTITSITFNKKERTGITKGKWNGENYNDYGDSYGSTLIKVEFKLSFE